MSEAKFEYGRPSADKGYGVTMHNISPDAYQDVRGFIGTQYMDDPDYHLKRMSGAFLQGDDGQGRWVFIEFWSELDCQVGAVRRLHDIFTTHHPEGAVEGLELLYSSGEASNVR